MTTSSPGDSLTTLLHQWKQGSDTAFAAIIDQVYDTLRGIAARRLSQSGTVTLSPTELVHEALMNAMPMSMEFNSRAHFLATMSLAIRSILIDHARARSAEKRGGGLIRVTLTGSELGEESGVVDLIAIEEALCNLEALDPRCGQVLHLTYFGGLKRDEVASVLNISVPTVDRDLQFGRSWLNAALSSDI
jgi:RNA polymerase sigma factor (TIGR02999 family)